MSTISYRQLLWGILQVCHLNPYVTWHNRLVSIGHVRGLALIKLLFTFPTRLPATFDLLISAPQLALYILLTTSCFRSLAKRGRNWAEVYCHCTPLIRTCWVCKTWKTADVGGIYFGMDLETISFQEKGDHVDVTPNCKLYQINYTILLVQPSSELLIVIFHFDKRSFIMISDKDLTKGQDKV